MFFDGHDLLGLTSNQKKFLISNIFDIENFFDINCVNLEARCFVLHGEIVGILWTRFARMDIKQFFHIKTKLLSNSSY